MEFQRRRAAAAVFPAISGVSVPVFWVAVSICHVPAGWLSWTFHFFTMIGTIRKHSKWLWWVIAGLTVISFLYWGVGPSARNGGIEGNGSYGTLYGRKITQQDYVNAWNEVRLFYWFRNHDWPEHNSNIKQKDQDEQIYLRLMLTQKADALGIHVSNDAAAAAAGDLLRSIGRAGQSVPIDAFVRQILQPEGLTADDFERFARNDVVIQQLVQTMGLAGSLVTPQEVAAAYQRDHQEVSAQIVFLSASNFIAQVNATPAVIAQFYTNYLAQYRLPDRVQVHYVEFNISNYLAAAEQTIGRTNLDNEVQNLFRQNGMESVPDAKTPEEAKAKIRDFLIRKQALTDARAQANDFATEVFGVNPLLADNLATVAKQKGLTVRLTEPFSSLYGPDQFTAPAAFTKSAFALTPDDPLAGPIVGPTGVYVIALAKQLPSEIPSLDQIRDRVTQDYRTVSAIMIAQRAGTNFAPELASQLMTGHAFASVCTAAGLHPETLPPFSLSTQDLPELANRASLQQIKQAVFSTPPGHASNFEGTEDGGFIVYIQSKLPVNLAAMNADLPQFTAGLRRQRESELFNQWVQTEANRQLRNTPVFAQQAAAGAK